MHSLSAHLCGLQGAQERRFVMTTWFSPQGPQSRSFVGPKSATTGMPTAAAMCMGPESTPKRLPPGAQLALCGPLRLMDAARQAWQRAGRPEADLRFETFGNSGAQAAEPFWVELPRHGLRIEVPADRNLLDMLEEHGVQALSDCRRGECGLCALDIVSVQGTVDHRDVFFSAHQKQANGRMCACVSRVCGGGVVLDSAFRPD